MFDNTRGALNKVLDDFKKMIYIIGLTIQTVIIGNFIYKLVINDGVLIANILFLILNSFYFIFLIYKYNKELKKEIAKGIKQWKTRVCKILTIVSFCYDLFFTLKVFSPIKFLITIFTAFGLIIELLLHIIYAYILKPKFEFIKAGFFKDIQPITNVVNFVNKLKEKKPICEIDENTEMELALAKTIQQEKDKLIKKEKQEEKRKDTATILKNIKAMIFKKKS